MQNPSFEGEKIKETLLLVIMQASSLLPSWVIHDIIGCSLREEIIDVYSNCLGLSTVSNELMLSYIRACLAQLITARHSSQQLHELL